ncbi:MAG: discoidin domain-containing protein [Paraprevotella sp.]|nr:discoidin domain-containing protein [Paraprevotella sp.]
MRKFAFSFMLCCLTATAAKSEGRILPGFYYGNDSQPSGIEWQSTDSLAYNKEQPRATFFSFADVESARRVLPENSTYWTSLNGEWKFNWAPTPEERPADFYKPEFDTDGWDDILVPSSWNIVGIQKDGSQKYGTPIYVNQPVIFQHRVAVDDWRGGVMRTPPSHWTTYKHRNEVGSYRRTFEIPAHWDGRQVFISFDGVDSFFYLWINGHYVGFSKNSRNAARFNITPYLVKGKNVVAAEVYRSSDGSFLEAQDMFRLPGIFRTVALYSTPEVQIRDLVATPDLTNNYQDGVLNITTDIRNLGKKDVKDYSLTYTLYANPLYSDENTPVEGVSFTSTPLSVKAGTCESSTGSLSVRMPKQWSAEAPYRYTLVAQLKDSKGKVVETVSVYTGFRKVEIKDTKAEDDEFNLAGRYYYINGKTVKLKGVNRHETAPALGHAITRTWMEQEVMMMKRANINHVRNCHYPDDPYWYYLCDKYGIYLEDEANIESHEYYYGDASLSHPKEWKNAHVARNMEMVHSTVNSPSVVIWSLGNEAGPGKNFVAAYEAIKAFDTSRPVQYERNNDIVDMGSNQYPSIGWTRGAVKGNYKIKYPFHISEYAHSMGNAVGNLVDYWDAIESTNFFCGGAIWDWIDQSLYNYDTKTGERYLAYGGDFGDTPNDGQFVMNGIIFGDMTPKPQYFEVKKVYQYVGVKAVDMKEGRIEVFNKNYFVPMTDYVMEWALYENGKKVQSSNVFKGTRNIQGPREKQMYTIPYDFGKLNPESEYFVTVQFKLASNKPWAKAGYVQAEEQLLVKAAGERPLISNVTKDGADIKVTSAKEDKIQTIEGENFKARFDMETGTIYSLAYNGQTVITEGNGPKLDAFRAFTNNDNWFYTQWFERGLHNLKHKVLSAQTFKGKNGSQVLSFTVESQAPNAARIHGGTSSGRNRIEELTNRPFGPEDFKFITNQIWTVYKDGSIELEAAITSNMQNLVLPRLGYLMRVPQQLGQFTYYGRGPVENYADRKTGQFIAEYQSTVKEQFADFPKPQSMGNHEDVRWAALTNGKQGVLFIANQPMATTALAYSEMDLTLAPHPYQLPAAGDTYLHLDLGMTGLGGNSCGQGGPLEHDCVKASEHKFGFIIRPAQQEKLGEAAQVAPDGYMPLSISRDRVGKVTISSALPDAEIRYTIDRQKKASTYTGEPISLRQGGKVTAWYKNQPEIKAELTFPKIETVDTEVIYASSEEGGSAKFLTDGDPSTIWHTMYSVTVAQYPHWVDLDAGEMKTIKGFTYMPRQEGNNGDIKDYRIYVSNDGKEWGEPIHEGRFEFNKDQKKVMFSKPVKARYFRFMGLSSQDGQDFASGAELGILAE